MESGRTGRSHIHVLYFCLRCQQLPRQLQIPRIPSKPWSLGEVGIFEKSTLAQLRSLSVVNQFLFTRNMAESIYSKYPPDLSPAQQRFLVTTVKDWAIQNGLAVRPSPAIIPPEADSNGVLATNAPVTLFPSPFPRTCFEEATALQKIYNELYAAITCNEEWLREIVEG